MSQLAESMRRFAEVYHAHPELVEEQRDWNPTIVLVAADSGETVTVQMRQGRVVRVSAEEAEGDLVITAERAMLCDILELRCGPNEPYLFGALTVRGAEVDFIRLDYITEMLCPH